MNSYPDLLSAFKEEADNVLKEQSTELKMKYKQQSVSADEYKKEFDIHLAILDQELTHRIQDIISKAAEYSEEENKQRIEAELHTWHNEYRNIFIKYLGYKG